MRISVEVTPDDVALIKDLLKRANAGDPDANTHGRLTINGLARMLLQDVALAERRPGSWEGSTMLQLLNSHGYQV